MTRFLREVRNSIKSQNMKSERLPMWVTSAHVEIGKLNNSNVFVFEDSPVDTDEVLFLGEFCSDLQFFLRLPEYLVVGASLKAPKRGKTGMVVLVGEYSREGKATFNIVAKNSALFNVGYVPDHMPMTLTNIVLQLSPLGVVEAIRFIPFALYIHDKDLSDFDGFWKNTHGNIEDLLSGLHNSAAGDYYAQIEERKRIFLSNKERTVIVFGKYGKDEVYELCEVRDYLGKLYDAHLLIELPEHPSMSLEQKVKLWASASRFCVMVDREASGHLVEYPYLKNSVTILALLRPKGGGSTSMIEEESVNFPYIHVFRFRKSPLEVLDTAISWAEDFVRKRSVKK